MFSVSFLVYGGTIYATTGQQHRSSFPKAANGVMVPTDGNSIPNQVRNFPPALPSSSSILGNRKHLLPAHMVPNLLRRIQRGLFASESMVLEEKGQNVTASSIAQHNATDLPSASDIGKAYIRLDIKLNASATSTTTSKDVTPQLRASDMTTHEEGKRVMEVDSVNPIFSAAAAAAGSKAAADTPASLLQNRTNVTPKAVFSGSRMQAAHFARVGGGCLWALADDSKLAQVEYHFRTNRRILLGRIDVDIKGPGEPSKVLAFLLNTISDMFPGFIIDVLVDHLQCPGAPAGHMWKGLEIAVSCRNMTTIYRRPSFLKASTDDLPDGIISSTALSRLSRDAENKDMVVDTWGVITLVPRPRIRDWNDIESSRKLDDRNAFLSKDLYDWSADIRVREVDAQGGGILYADLRDRNKIVREVGRLIYHDRSASPNGSVRIAFLHVKSQYRERKVASVLLDHLHRCLFPNRTIQLIFQASSNEIQSAWATFRSFGRRHSLSCWRYPKNAVYARDLFEDEKYQPSTFEILEFQKKTRIEWDPYINLVKSAKEAVGILEREVDSIIRASNRNGRALDPHPVVARLDIRQAHRVRSLVREATQPLSTIAYLMTNNAHVGSTSCCGLHPPGHVKDETQRDATQSGFVEMDIGGLMRMLLERIFIAVS